MSMLSRSLGTLLALTASLAVLPAASARASSGSGAQVVSRSSCEQILGGTFCTTEHAVHHEVTTPSGNQVLVTNLWLRVRGTYGSGQPYTSDWSLKDDVVLRDGATQEYHVRSTSVSVDGLSSLTCTFVVLVHFANGAVQFDGGVDTCI